MERRGAVLYVQTKHIIQLQNAHEQGKDIEDMNVKAKAAHTVCIQATNRGREVSHVPTTPTHGAQKQVAPRQRAPQRQASCRARVGS